MMETKKYKLNLYELFFYHPLSTYKININNKVYQNVLFIGEEQKAIETVRTVFWDSQYPNCRTCVTYAASEKDKLVNIKEHFNDSAKYPALKEYIDKGYMDEINVYELHNDKELDSLKDLVVGEKSFSYIIIATGDSYKDWNYLSALESLYDEYKLPNVMIAIYNDGLNEMFSKINQNKLAQNVSVQQFEKSEEDSINTELKNVAQNINLAYGLKYNQRMNIENYNKEFNELCNKEFQCNDNTSYSADSSYASATHISVKIDYCLDFCGVNIKDKNERHRKGLELLNNAIHKKDELYNKLVQLEHQRWNAYMVMLGYSYPKAGEKGYISEGSNDHRDKINKLHMCLCESGDTLNKDMEKSDFWKKRRSKLAPLDNSSFVCNEVADRKARALYKTVYSDYPFLNSVIFRELKDAIEGLFCDENDSIENYNSCYIKTLENMKMYPDEKIVRELEDLNKKLQIVIIRNKKINFFQYDAQLVDMIPFCMWYGKKYYKVIVFASGIPTKDIVIPTMLLSKEAIFVYENEIEDAYKEVIINYFKGRGNNTTPIFVDNTEIENVVENQSEEIFVVSGEGFAKEKFLRNHSRLINVRYDVKNRTIYGDTKEFTGLEPQGLSVKELIKLLGGTIIDRARSEIDNDTFTKLEQYFWNKGSEKRNWNNKSYIPWNSSASFFKECRDKKSDEFITFKDTDKSLVHIFEGLIGQEIYEEKAIGDLLYQLNDYHLISNLKCKLIDKNINVVFRTYHKEICDELEKFTEHKIPNYTLSLINILDITNTDSNHFMYRRSDKYINKNGRYYDTELLEKLAKMGICTELKIVNGNVESLIVKNQKVRKFIQFEGDMLEKSVYNKMKRSGLFDDVSTGVHFFWNNNKELKKNEQNIKLKYRLDKLALKDKAELGLVSISDFCNEREKIINEQKSATVNKNYNAVAQEVDVIAIRGMQPYFLSAKSRLQIEVEFLNEIANESKKAGAIAIIASCLDIKEAMTVAIQNRAQEDNIIALGKQELKNEDDLLNILNKVTGKN